MLVGEEIVTKVLLSTMTWAGANFQGLAAKKIWKIQKKNRVKIEKIEKKTRPLQGNDQKYALFSLSFFFTPHQTKLESPVSVFNCQALDCHSYNNNNNKSLFTVTRIKIQ